ncbi:hypothetical protein Tco_0291022 [Tanacetum coccineum]
MLPPPEKFSGGFSDRNIKRFSSPDLPDPHHHAPPLAITAAPSSSPPPTTADALPPTSPSHPLPPRHPHHHYAITAAVRHHQQQHHATIINPTPPSSSSSSPISSLPLPAAVLSFGLLDVLCGVYVQYDTLSRLIKISYSLSFENQIMLPLHFTYASANV